MTLSAWAILRYERGYVAPLPYDPDAIDYTCRGCKLPQRATDADVNVAWDKLCGEFADGPLPDVSDAEAFHSYGRKYCPRCATKGERR